MPCTAAAASGEFSTAARICPTMPPPTAPLMASPAFAHAQILERAACCRPANGAGNQLDDQIG